MADSRILLVLVALLPLVAWAADSLDRVELVFETGRRVETTPLGSSLVVEARLSHRAGGPVRGAWEVAEPPGAASRPLWQALARFDVLLAGAGETVLSSPALPTRQTGLHQVRLHFESPVLDSEALRYQVIAH